MRIIDLFALQIFAKNLDRCKFRLLQHYLPMSDIAVSFEYFAGASAPRRSTIASSIAAA
jgi:hypothetical protein